MFRNELESLINRHSLENGSNTPDFLLAGYLKSCLDAFDHAVRERDKWYSVELAPGRTGGAPALQIGNSAMLEIALCLRDYMHGAGVVPTQTYKDNIKKRLDAVVAQLQQ